MKNIVDVHSHVLYGVDDGAPDLQTACAMLQKEYEDGVRILYATPHFRRNMFEPSQERVLEAYEVMKREAARIGIDLYLGCEYHANMEMKQDFKSGRRLTMGDSKCLLIEFSTVSTKQFIKERVYYLLSEGYIPIIAHAERYPVLNGNFDFIDELSQRGCLIQINSGSFLGESGWKIKRFCKRMLMYDLVDLIGSDCHNMKSRRPQMDACAGWLTKKIGYHEAERLLCENPYRLIYEKNKD